jgi:hypothetical protein
MNDTQLKQQLLKIERLERDACRLWDEAVSSLAYGILTDEMKDGYVKKTYEASRLHLEAMALLEDIVRHLDENVSPAADLPGVTWFCGIGGVQ